MKWSCTNKFPILQMLLSVPNLTILPVLCPRDYLRF